MPRGDHESYGPAENFFGAETLESDEEQESEEDSNFDQPEAKGSKSLKEQKKEAFSSHPTQDKLVVTVLDSGIGIRKKDQRKMFRMFGCLKNTRQMNTQGIGLGLFISKIIVNQFQGSIFLQSQYKKGTRFTFSFLLDDNHKSKTIPKLPSSKKISILQAMKLNTQPLKLKEILSPIQNQTSHSIPLFRFKKESKNLDTTSRILIADDEVFNLEAMKGLFKILGFPNYKERLVCCYNGLELVQKV